MIKPVFFCTFLSCDKLDTHFRPTNRCRRVSSAPSLLLEPIFSPRFDVPLLPSWYLPVFQFSNPFQHIFLFVFFHEKLATFEKLPSQLNSNVIRTLSTPLTNSSIPVHDTLQIMPTIVPVATCFEGLLNALPIHLKPWHAHRILSFLLLFPHPIHLNSAQVLTSFSPVFPAFSFLSRKLESCFFLFFSSGAISSLSFQSQCAAYSIDTYIYFLNCSMVQAFAAAIAPPFTSAPSFANSSAFSFTSITSCSSAMDFFSVSVRCALTHFTSRPYFLSAQSISNCQLCIHKSASFCFGTIQNSSLFCSPSKMPILSIW